jgi:hypothetical protein
VTAVSTLNNILEAATVTTFLEEMPQQPRYTKFSYSYNNYYTAGMKRMPEL